MERDANYTAVGAFVLLIAVMAGMFVYWYSEGRDRRSYVPYEIYFTGSVTGLSEGGSVRYLGVEVGRVRRIRLDRRSPERVQVVADIDESAPVGQDTTAQLSLMGVTGLLYIDLKQKVEGKEIMPLVESERYPVINSVRSDFDTFLASLPEIAGSAAELLNRAQEIFSPENSAALADMVKNLHEASVGLPATMKRVDELVGGLGSTSDDVRELAQGLRGATDELRPEVAQLAQRLNRTADNLERASRGIEAFVAENRAGVTAFAQDGLPQLQRTLQEARDAAAEFAELSRSLKADPSQLIYQPVERGVKVKR
ncbi:MAG: MCE family protein [Proteobacteria bacterium]|nr:MCE family protein [Pseudomonadota bacterium]MBK9252323.1 MCE family protein [Pseudomonadota bacterium]